jgi:tRNA 2-thiouridine synthesizing protein A
LWNFAYSIRDDAADVGRNGICPTERATPIGTTEMDVMTLDATGLLCPLPVLKARKALKPLAPGAVLEIRATDQGAVKDFAAFCRTTGNELISSREEDGVFIFAIRKTAA